MWRRGSTSSQREGQVSFHNTSDKYVVLSEEKEEGEMVEGQLNFEEKKEEEEGDERTMVTLGVSERGAGET